MKCRSARDKKTTDPNVFSKTIAAANSTIELLEPYYRSNKKIQVRCKICGHQWSTWPQQILRGDNCPNCIKRLSTSFPEQALYYYLNTIYPDAINSFKDGVGKTELDIVIDLLRELLSKE